MQSELQIQSYITNPGYILFSDEPILLCAVCGSGVVVTLWDKMRHRGGMVHCVFPKRRLRERPTNYHIDVAIPSLVKQFCASYSGNLEAQIFGGASPRGFSPKKSLKTVEVAKRLLKKFCIAIVSEDVGGSIGRKIMFNTSSGDVLLLRTKKIRRVDWAPEYMLGHQYRPMR